MVIKHWQKPYAQIIISLLLTICMLMTPAISSARPNNDGLRIYQNTPQLSEEHKQNIADDINRFKQADDLWDVLRDEFSLPHYEDNPLVQDKIEWFMNNQDFLLRSVKRASPYLHYILQQVRKRHLPAELVLLPIVESGYNPFAVSNMGAAGIWQLMPGTATGLGVRQDLAFDGRRDVIASTGAALNYLAYLQSFFDGNWLLAIAAYNTGEGNVQAAIRRNIRDGRQTDFWSLPVAQETKNYVPSILALAIIISNPDQYPIYFPRVKNAPYLAQFSVRSKINLKIAAALAGLSYKQMLQLNPGFKKPNAKGPTKIILPIENVEKFADNLVRSPYKKRDALGWVHYRMKAGDTLTSVARKFKTTTDEIRKLNRLVKTNPRRGTNLLIPDHSGIYTEIASTTEIEKHSIPSASHPKTRKGKKVLASNRRSKQRQQSSIQISSPYRMQPGDTVYMVRNKDTIDKIATKFHVERDALIIANGLKSKQVTPGKHMIIPTHRGEIKLAVSGRKRAILPNEKLYKVRHGDTIAKIAKRFQTTQSSIRIANLVDDSSLREGAHLVIPQPIRG